MGTEILLPPTSEAPQLVRTLKSPGRPQKTLDAGIVPADREVKDPRGPNVQAGLETPACAFFFLPLGSDTGREGSEHCMQEQCRGTVTAARKKPREPN